MERGLLINAKVPHAHQVERRAGRRDSNARGRRPRTDIENRKQDSRLNKIKQEQSRGWMDGWERLFTASQAKLTEEKQNRPSLRFPIRSRHQRKA
ncbi:hypothetical protein B0H12DRAFT_846774 [Mycena haematopus]|nr:hypothetical protein B0H12DRAFT_846774 [Mycena haematopus]